MIIEIILSIFLGYFVGRIGDYFAGHWNFFHHWVYGFILFVFGMIYKINTDKNIFIFYIGFFGLGLIISDLEDFLHFRAYGADKKSKKRFWAFD